MSRTSRSTSRVSRAARATTRPPRARPAPEPTRSCHPVGDTSPMGHDERVIVVGAGVVGLTCAVRLLEAGRRVDVVARDLPRETTSAVAAAIWYPYRALPQDRVMAWARTSYAVFDALADTDPESGVRMVPGTEVLAAPVAEPWWRSAVPHLERTRDVPAGWAEGWSFTTPVADMTTYLPWLAGRVAELGGTITRLNLSA